MIYLTDAVVTDNTLEELPRITSHVISKKAKKGKRKVSLVESINLGRKFIRGDAIQYFLQTWERTLVAWASLLHVSSLPDGVPITNFNVVAAAQAIDSVIAGETELPSRFGYVQFFSFIEILRSRIQAEKTLGFIEPRPSVVNASHAYEIYRMAQNKPSAPEQLRHWKRVGGRLKQLASSDLLLTIVSITADCYA
jgi:hypothetical protein